MPPTAQSFAEAIAAIAERGDRAAFEKLFNHFAPRLKSYLSRLGTSGERAEELAQETLLVVWRRAASFDPARAAPATWIFTIARNLRIDDARRQGRARDYESLEDPTMALPAPAQPDHLLSVRQDQGRVSGAMRHLSADQINAVREAFFSDKPHSEIAADLGLPLGTVKSRLRLAIGKLRLALDKAR